MCVWTRRLGHWLASRAGPPVPRHRGVPWATGGLAVASLLGWWVEFLPRPVLYSPACVAASAVLGAGSAFWLCRRALTTDEVQRTLRATPGRLLLGYLATPFLLAAMYWCTATRTLPWLYTAVAGQSYAELHQARTDHGGRRCASIRGESLKQGLRDRVCIGRRLYHRYPHQPVTAHLTGKRSWLGATVKQIHLEPPSCPNVP